MFDFVEYIHDFYHALLTALELYTDFDMSLVNYTFGTRSHSLFSIIEFSLVSLTLIMIVRGTFRIFMKFYKFVGGKFGWNL